MYDFGFAICDLRFHHSPMLPAQMCNSYLGNRKSKIQNHLRPLTRPTDHPKECVPSSHRMEIDRMIQNPEGRGKENGDFVLDIVRGRISGDPVRDAT